MAKFPIYMKCVGHKYNKQKGIYEAELIFRKWYFPIMWFRILWQAIKTDFNKDTNLKYVSEHPMYKQAEKETERWVEIQFDAHDDMAKIK